MTRLKQLLADPFHPENMPFSPDARKNLYLLLFLIIPVIFLVNASVIHYNKGKMFLTNVDPEYFFLYNGALIGGGHLNVPYTSNPGTPLMVLIALSSRMVGFFQPGEYFGDIVNDPEKYIHSAHFLLAFLIAVALFFCGWYVREKTGSWMAGLLLQMCLPGSAALMFLSGMVKAEAITILPVLLLSLATIHYVFSAEDRESPSGKTLFLFGLICGFGMACKLIFIPLVLLPLILLKSSFIQKLKLLAWTTLAFAVFAYPVLFNYGNFWGWVGGIISHTGKYGYGQKGFIDLASVPGNLDRLYDSDRAFFYITGISLVLGTIMTWRYPRIQGSPLSRRLGRSLLAVSLAILACIALVLKHFEVHYFFPVHVLKFLMISSIYLLLIRLDWIYNSKIWRSIVTGFILLAVLYLSYGELMKIRSYNQKVMALEDLQDTEYRTVVSLVKPGNPVILSGMYYGTPFVEFAHSEGLKMSYIPGQPFIPYLKEKYPMTYQYVAWSDKFYQWGDFIDFKRILDKASRYIYLFIGENQGDSLPVIESRIWEVVDKVSVSREVVYQNPATGVQMIELTILTGDSDAGN